MVVVASQLAALTAFYASTNGNQWTTKTNWMMGDACDWYGVTCDDTSTNVVELDFEENNLSGSLPTQLGLLTMVTSGLGFQRNSIHGAIPTELGLLTKMTEGLYLQTNSFSGSVPSELGLLTGLTYSIQLDGNQLTSTLPSELGQLTMLEYSFYAGNNKLTGLIPSELGRLSSLSHFFCLVSNQLTGSVPSELGRLNQLAEEFDLGFNSICGVIPDQVALLSNSVSLFQVTEGSVNMGTSCCLVADNKHVSSCASYALSSLYSETNGAAWLKKKNWLVGDPCANSWYGVACTLVTDSGSGDIYRDVTKLELNDNNLQNSIPTELGLLSVLSEQFRLDKNHLTGTLPSELGLLTRLTDLLYLWSNSLEGMLPSQLGCLSLVKQRFKLISNRFEGSIPSELGQLTGITIEFKLSHNSFSGSLPSELGRLSLITGFFDLSTNQLCSDIPAQVSALESHVLVGWGLAAGNEFGTQCPSPHPTAMPMIPTPSPSTAANLKKNGGARNGNVQRVHIAVSSIAFVIFIAVGSCLMSSRLSYMLYTDKSWDRVMNGGSRSSEAENKSCLAYTFHHFRRSCHYLYALLLAIDRCLGYIAVNIVLLMWRNGLWKSSPSNADMDDADKDFEQAKMIDDSSDDSDDDQNSDEESERDQDDNEDFDEEDVEEDVNRAGRRSYLRAMGIRRRGASNNTSGSKKKSKKKKTQSHSLGGFVKRLAYGESLIPKARKKTVVAMELGVTDVDESVESTMSELGMFEDEVATVTVPKPSAKYNF